MMMIARLSLVTALALVAVPAAKAQADVFGALQAMSLTSEQSEYFDRNTRRFFADVRSTVGRSRRRGDNDEGRRLRRDISRLFKKMDKGARQVLDADQWPGYLRYKAALADEMQARFAEMRRAGRGRAQAQR